MGLHGIGDACPVGNTVCFCSFVCKKDMLACLGIDHYVFNYELVGLPLCIDSGSRRHRNSIGVDLMHILGITGASIIDLTTVPTNKLVTLEIHINKVCTKI